MQVRCHARARPPPANQAAKSAPGRQFCTQRRQEKLAGEVGARQAVCLEEAALDEDAGDVCQRHAQAVCQGCSGEGELPAQGKWEGEGGGLDEGHGENGQQRVCTATAS